MNNDLPVQARHAVSTQNEIESIKTLEQEYTTEKIDHARSSIDKEDNAATPGSYGIAAAPYPSSDPQGFDDSHHHNHPTATSRRSSSVTTLDEESGQRLPPASRVSTDAHGNVYPEGGFQAWLVVFGSFAGLFVALGIMNTLGPYQAWFLEHQLKGYDPGTVGWIFGMYAFLSFFCGIQIGPVFDAKGPVLLVLAGSCIIFLSTMLLGVCTKYWHLMLVFGVLGGLGTSLIFSPAISAIGHWFNRRRGLATGAAAAGGSLGGIIFPLILEHLLPKYGFAWATRIVAFVQLAFLVLAVLCIRSRLPPKRATKENILPDFKVFRDPVFALTTMGIFFSEWGLFVPITYISSYAQKHHPGNEQFSYTVLMILNAGSCVGRWAPGIIADHIGRFNCIIAMAALCGISSLAIWMVAGNSVAVLIVYAIIFGFASGSTISITPVCVGQLCKTEHYGRYYATAYTVVSFAALTGVPIAGSIQNSDGGQFWGLIVFTGCAYAAALACYIGARVWSVGWKLTAKY